MPKNSRKNPQKRRFWPALCNARTALPSIQSSLASRASIQPTPWRKWEATLPQRPPQQNISFHIDNDANAIHKRREEHARFILYMYSARIYAHTRTHTRSTCVRTNESSSVRTFFFSYLYVHVLYINRYRYISNSTNEWERMRERWMEWGQGGSIGCYSSGIDVVVDENNNRSSGCGGGGIIDRRWKYRLAMSVCARVHDLCTKNDEKKLSAGRERRSLGHVKGRWNPKRSAESLKEKNSRKREGRCNE